MFVLLNIGIRLGCFMHINNNLYITNNPRIRKNDANVNSQAVDNLKDFVNSPNPAEYIGRSQVVFSGRGASKPENKQILPELKKEDLQPFDIEKYIYGLFKDMMWG